MTQEQLTHLWGEFKSLGADALGYSHYDLATKTDEPSQVLWKEFLMYPDVVDYIISEMTIIRNAAINQMIQTSPESRSVGQSQLLNSLQKYGEEESKREGPAFIYCHVPLNSEQKYAKTVRECDASGIEITNEGVCIIDES